ESAYPHGSNGCLGAAGNHHVGIAILDDPGSISYRVSAGGAGRASRLVRTLSVVADAHLPSCQIDDCCRNKKWRDFARTAIQQVGMLALDDIESPDAGTDIDPGALRQLFAIDF